MQPVIVNTIVNYVRHPDLAASFEDAFDQFHDELERALEGMSGTPELQTIYVQFQFDNHGMPNAAKGRKLGRYSSSKRHTSATIEVTQQSVRDLSEEERVRWLARETLEALQALEVSLSRKVTHAIGPATAAISSRFWPAPV
ncbi:MAG: hypothetical protein WC538_06310 [Thermoanaerobaculia bacterium]|jgi:hypothetical protein